MSRRTFAETVINLAVESCLVCHVDEVLTPSKVNLMGPEELAELASESPDVTHERTQLEKQVEKLKDGLRICRRHRPRGAQGPLSRRCGVILSRTFQLTGSSSIIFDSFIWSIKLQTVPEW